MSMFVTVGGGSGTPGERPHGHKEDRQIGRERGDALAETGVVVVSDTIRTRA